MASNNINTWKYLGVGITIFLLIALLFTNSIAQSSFERSPADTPDPCGYLSGIISTNTTLTEGCTYIVTGHVLVEDGVTLTAEPGVTVKFDGLYYIKVEGVLSAIGTEDQRIVFTSNMETPAPKDWANIELAGSEPSMINYAIVEYGGGYFTKDEAVVARNGSHTINQVIFQKNDDAIVLDGNQVVQNSLFVENTGRVLTISNRGSPSIIGNLFVDNAGPTTIVVCQYYGCDIIGTVLIQDNIFQANTGAFIIDIGWSFNISSVIIQGNTFINNSVSYDNGPGVIVIDTSNLVTIQCNLFIDNQAIGTITYPGGIISIKYSSTDLIINSNNIYPGFGQYDLSIRRLANDQTDLDVTGNYWGTVNLLEIDERIYDYYDDFNLPKVSYAPIETSPLACVPPLPTPTPTPTSTSTPTPTNTPTPTPTVTPVPEEKGKVYLPYMKR